MMERINHRTLYPTQVKLQLADSTIRTPKGVIRGLPTRIQGKYIRQDFLVLDDDTPLVLGRPFLNEANAKIDLRNGTIHLCIWDKDTKFDFQQGDENGFLVQKDDWFGEWAEIDSEDEAPFKIDERDEWNYKPSYPMISCDAGDVHVTQALCDSGADTSIMSLELFNAINSSMTPTDTQIQLANSTLYQPEGMVQYVLIKIQVVYIVVDFLVVKTSGKNDIPHFRLSLDDLSYGQPRHTLICGEKLSS